VASTNRLRIRLWAALSSPRAALLVVSAGVLLTAASVANGIAMDDRFQQAMVRGYSPLVRAPWDLYRFLSGDPSELRGLMDLGLLPWFTLPEVKTAFFRPLSSLSVYADYALLPSWPWLFHLESIALYAALIALVFALYRALMPDRVVAALAALLFAVDDAHGLPVGWLANRNALFAGVFGVAALVFHHRAVTRRARPDRVLAPVRSCSRCSPARSGSPRSPTSSPTWRRSTAGRCVSGRCRCFRMWQ
jgi:hypothetical protein